MAADVTCTTADKNFHGSIDHVDGGGNRRQADSKPAALARGTFEVNPSAVGLGDGAGDAEAQPDTLLVAGARIRGPMEPAEDLFLLIG